MNNKDLVELKTSKMDTEAFSKTTIGQIFIKAIAAIMESRLRYNFFGPAKLLEGSEIKPGQQVVEIGCGTGFFTIPAAQIIGDQGLLIAMDILPISVETVAKKVQEANLKNVRVMVGDALKTQLDNESVDAIIIFGVIPAPMLPMEKLLAEMHRILKPDGTMAIWPPSWALKSVTQSGLFSFSSKRNSVSNYKRC